MKKLSRNEFLTDLFIQGGHDQIFDAIAAAVFGASNRLTIQSFTESIMVDDSWIDAIEEYLPHIEKIVRKPKSFIIDEHHIVPIEKAKRVTSESIRHLSSHTSNIRGIEDDGTVIPSKLLTTLFEEDLAIYENRFVFTLINRVAMFVEQQFNGLKGISPSETVKLEHNTAFEAAGYKFKYQMVTSVSKPFEGANKNLKRVEDLMFRLTVIKGSQFYQALRKTKPVRPPIMRTNILKMDVDYSIAYKLWVFIAACVKLGYTVNHASRHLPTHPVFEDVLRLANAYSARGFLYHLEDIDKMPAVIPFRKKAKKKFKIVEKNIFEPTVLRSREPTPHENAAEYYLEKITDMLLTEKSGDEKKSPPSYDADDEQEDNTPVYVENRIKEVPFDALYSQITQLNEALYYDALGVELEKQVRLPGESQNDFKLREAKVCDGNARALKLLIELKEKELADLKRLTVKQAEKAEQSLSVNSAKAASKKPKPAKKAAASKKSTAKAPKAKTDKAEKTATEKTDKVATDKAEKAVTDTAETPKKPRKSPTKKAQAETEAGGTPNQDNG